MTQKGIYPYDYVDSFDKMNDEQLPEQEKIIVDYMILIVPMKIINKL